MFSRDSSSLRHLVFLDCIENSVTSRGWSSLLHSSDVHREFTRTSTQCWVCPRSQNFFCLALFWDGGEKIMQNKNESRVFWFCLFLCFVASLVCLCFFFLIAHECHITSHPLWWSWTVLLGRMHIWCSGPSSKNCYSSIPDGQIYAPSEVSGLEAQPMSSHNHSARNSNYLVLVFFLWDSWIPICMVGWLLLKVWTVCPVYTGWVYWKSDLLLLFE